MSSKSSQEAIVAQVTSSITSLSGYITRQGSRSSPSWEKCFRRTAKRARGTSSSRIEAVLVSMIALHAESERHGITACDTIQNYPVWPVNLSSHPCPLCFRLLPVVVNSVRRSSKSPSEIWCCNDATRGQSARRGLARLDSNLTTFTGL